MYDIILGVRASRALQQGLITSVEDYRPSKEEIEEMRHESWACVAGTALDASEPTLVTEPDVPLGAMAHHANPTDCGTAHSAPSDNTAPPTDEGALAANVAPRAEAGLNALSPHPPGLFGQVPGLTLQASTLEPESTMQIPLSPRYLPFVPLGTQEDLVAQTFIPLTSSTPIGPMSMNPILPDFLSSADAATSQASPDNSTLPPPLHLDSMPTAHVTPPPTAPQGLSTGAQSQLSPFDPEADFANWVNFDDDDS
jgi:hypothetical protein